MAILDNELFFGTDGFAENGATTITENGNATIVQGRFTPGAWDASQSGRNVSDFGAFGVTEPVSAEFTFSNAVENLSFDIQHLNDDGASTFDDSWTILAYDDNGDQIPAADIIAGLTGLDDETVSVNPDGSVQIEANGTNPNDVTVNLVGPVSSLQLTLSPGSGGSQSGGSGISDFSFDVPVADIDGDGIADADDLDTDGDGLTDAEEGLATVSPSTITIAFNGDEFAASEEDNTRWELRDPDGNLVASDDNISSGTTVTTISVGDLGDYSFTVFDDFGDGISGDNPARFTVSVDDTVVIDSGPNPNFGTTFSESFAVEEREVTRDTDGDGVADHLDLDSDNDGITDNVEAQSTDGYVAPSGSDSNGDGIDDSYANGLTPVDTDGDGTADYLDSDSDDDGVSDADEAGHGQSQQAIDASGDADFDGIADVVDDVDGRDVNDTDVDGGIFTLSDSDGDRSASGNGAAPGTADFDYRDATGRDFIVEGSSGSDRIDDNYAGDPDNDRIDNNDAADGSDDDLVLAGAGDDEVEGGAGSDTLRGEEGDDTLTGGYADGTAGIGGTSQVGNAFTVISLGNRSDSDADETDGGQTDNAEALLGTFGGFGAELYNNFASAVANDTDGNGQVDDDDDGTVSETITIDGTDLQVDSATVYSATATFIDGTSGTFSAVVFQTTTGDVFLAPELSDNTDNALLTSAPIESISLNGVLVDNTFLSSNRLDANYRVPANDTSADSLDGGAGNDDLRGAAGDDTLEGGSGNDTLGGSMGRDSLIGGDGDDVIRVSEGDTADGGEGDDLFILEDLRESGNASITIVGGEGGETEGDTLQLTPDVSFSDITFTDTDDENGGLSGNFTTSDGTFVSFSEIENIICFTPGTRILTEAGERAIDTLRPGDRIITRDHGAQPLRWMGRRSVPGIGHLAPIELSADSLPGLSCTTRVSPQHRFLLSGYEAELLFGEEEVLVAAKHLIDHQSVRRIACPEVTYLHMMFDHHEVVFANGCATESFHAADTGMSAVSAKAREEIFAIFPELRWNFGGHGATARMCLTAREARLLSSQGDVANHNSRYLSACGD
ncbi:Hint domain-containing protein [Sulfitobacter sp. S190]|uniref:Hint domain-containing protein n=1 Tax=Sulfitobacter sp. S190 TaxID=2867022 RepID=UPI0021A851AE|nr:Hint domain-containing protein [Sulfitobacter sp. S190]UWR24303.1 Hint domain-containing protein [Sulfitobacter sp. S190]